MVENPNFGDSAAVTTKRTDFTAFEVTIHVPPSYSLSGSPKQHVISMYAGPFNASEHHGNARCEAGIMIYPKDSPDPNNRGPMAIVNPVKGGGGRFDGASQAGQRNLALENFEDKSHPGQYKIQVILDGSNRAHVKINGKDFIPKDATKHGGSGSFVFGYKDKNEHNYNPVGLANYPHGIKWKYDVGIIDLENPNVSFKGAKITEIRGGKIDAHGQVDWLKLTGKDLDYNPSLALPGAHYDKLKGTLEVSRSLEHVDQSKDKPIHIKLDGPTQVMPGDTTNPALNLTPLPNKQSLLNDPLHDTAVSSMLRMNDERGIPTDHRTYNAAAFIAAAAYEKGLKEINQVKPSEDGTKLMAVQGQPGISESSKVVVVSTMTALNTPVDASTAAYANAALNKGEQPAAPSIQPNQQVGPAPPIAVPVR